MALAWRESQWPKVPSRTRYRRLCYFPPGFYRRNGTESKFGLSSDSLVLVEGEFKDLSLLELGIYSIGLPSFVVYSNDENGNRQLLRDLQVTITKEKPDLLYFLGDGDTASNFEFSRQASFLASAAYPSKVFLPRIGIDRPKGIDDCKEALGEDFGEYFTELISTAIPLDRKINETALALILLERELDRLKALQGPERERQFSAWSNWSLPRNGAGKPVPRRAYANWLPNCSELQPPSLKRPLKRRIITKQRRANRSSSSKKNGRLEPGES